MPLLLLVALVGGGLVAYEIIKNFANSGSSDMSTNPEAPNSLPLGMDFPGKLDASQIAPLAQQAGFQGDDLITAIAVALAESGGNPVAYNPETKANTPTGLGSFGLWQIYRKVHPEFSGWNLYDPQSNANAAYSVYKAAGYSFRPWSTYTQTNPKTGAYWYEAHLTEAQQAVA